MNGFRVPAKAEFFSLVLSAAILVLPACAQHPSQAEARGIFQARNISIPTTLAPDEAVTQSECIAKGEKEISIVCDYPEDRMSPLTSEGGEHIALDRTVISFKTDDENYMSVDLTFTNLGTKMASNAREVYLSIEDEAGQNQVHRVLPHVDLTKLGPNEHLTFKDRILVGAFRRGRYTIYLSIPDSSSPKFNPALALLLSNLGGPKPKKMGLNRIAMFTVIR